MERSWTCNNPTALSQQEPPRIRLRSVSCSLINRGCPERRAPTSFSLCKFYFFAIIEDMGEHNYLGEFELMILLTIIRLGDNAYGVPLSRELAIRRGRDVSVGSVYAALDRLEIKGLITSSLGESTPERGGRAKRYFRVTEQGLCSVHATRRVLSELWKSLPSPGEEPA